MKIADNRALMAKKRIYNQPEVQVAHITLESIVLAGSPAPEPAGETMGFNLYEGEQW